MNASTACILKGWFKAELEEDFFRMMALSSMTNTFRIELSHHSKDWIVLGMINTSDSDEKWQGRL